MSKLCPGDVICLSTLWISARKIDKLPLTKIPGNPSDENPIVARLEQSDVGLIVATFTHPHHSSFNEVLILCPAGYGWHFESTVSKLIDEI